METKTADNLQVSPQLAFALCVLLLQDEKDVFDRHCARRLGTLNTHGVGAIQKVKLLWTCHYIAEILLSVSECAASNQATSWSKRLNALPLPSFKDYFRSHQRTGHYWHRK